MTFLAWLAAIYILGMCWGFVNVRKDIGFWRIVFVTVFWWLFIRSG